MAPSTYFDGDEKTGPLETPYIKLFGSPTANNQKVFILLELLHADYKYRSLDYLKDTKEPWFLKINPNGKVPLLEDVDAEGKPYYLAESGAILIYLADKLDTERKFSYAPGSEEYFTQLEILFFHLSGLNPQQASLNWTRANEPENKKNVERYTNGTIGSYEILEKRLADSKSGFLVGDHISLADLVAYPHASTVDKNLVGAEKFPFVTKWVETISALPEVKKAWALK